MESRKRIAMGVEVLQFAKEFDVFVEAKRNLAGRKMIGEA